MIIYLIRVAILYHLKYICIESLFSHDSAQSKGIKIVNKIPKNSNRA